MLIVAIVLLSAVVSLPFSAYRTFAIESRFGFNRTTLGTWLADLGKGVLVGAVLGLPLAALVIALMRYAGGAWWLWAWVAWMGFQFLVLALYPTVIAPLFNKFTPMPDGPARERIEALLARCGFASPRALPDGRVEALEPRQRLLHRLRACEAHRDLRHAPRAPHARGDRGRARARAGSLQAQAHREAHRVVGRSTSLAFFALLAWLARADWFYGGLYVPPSPERPGVALVLFFLVLPVFTFLLAPVASLVFAPARVRGGRLRRASRRPPARWCRRSCGSTRTTRRRSRRIRCTRRSTIRIRPRRCGWRTSRRWRPRRSGGPMSISTLALASVVAAACMLAVPSAHAHRAGRRVGQGGRRGRPPLAGRLATAVPRGEMRRRCRPHVHALRSPRAHAAAAPRPGELLQYAARHQLLPQRRTNVAAYLTRGGPVQADERRALEGCEPQAYADDARDDWLDDAAIAQRLAALDGWQLDRDRLVKSFTFADYPATRSSTRWRRCAARRSPSRSRGRLRPLSRRWRTHDADGVTQRPRGGSHGALPMKPGARRGGNRVRPPARSRTRRRGLAPPLRGRCSTAVTTLECVLSGRRLSSPAAIGLRSCALPAAARSKASSRAPPLYRSDTFREKVIAANVPGGRASSRPTSRSTRTCSTGGASPRNASGAASCSSPTSPTSPASRGSRRGSRSIARSAIPSSDVRGGTPSPIARRGAAGEHSVLIGQSGMGKSTILNALCPLGAGADRRVSRRAGHRPAYDDRYDALHARTRARPTAGSSTRPASRRSDIAHVDPACCRSTFARFRAALGHCRFRDCRHDREPGCAVRARVDDGAASPRTDSRCCTRCCARARLRASPKPRNPLLE